MGLRREPRVRGTAGSKRPRGTLSQEHATVRVTNAGAVSDRLTAFAALLYSRSPQLRTNPMVTRAECGDTHLSSNTIKLRFPRKRFDDRARA